MLNCMESSYSELHISTHASMKNTWFSLNYKGLGARFNIMPTFSFDWSVFLNVSNNGIYTLLKRRNDYTEKDLQIAGATQSEVLYLRYLSHDYMFLHHNALSISLGNCSCSHSNFGLSAYFHVRESFGFMHKSVNVCFPADKGSCFFYMRLKIDSIRLK